MSDGAQPVFYTCARCGKRSVAVSAFEADKPVGFYINVLKVTGERYPHHNRTPETVFFCTKECLIDGLQYGISGMVEEIVPIGLDPLQIPPSQRWRQAKR